MMIYDTIASFPGPFEKSEKMSWYLLFAHALNFLTFWEFWIIPVTSVCSDIKYLYISIYLIVHC